MMYKQMIFIAMALMVLNLSTVLAQEPSAMMMVETDSIAGMDHSNMNHGTMPGADQGDMSGTAEGTAHDMGNMKSGDTMKRGSMSMQGGAAPANARSPDYSDGYDFGAIPRPVLADEHNFASLLVNRFERVKTDDNASATYDLQAWYGRDYDRAALKAEGDIDGGDLQEASTELLWSHAIATFWNTQLGVRYDSGNDPNRTWLAFGVQGLAPYWFELDATGYIREGGRTAFTLEVEYELLLTQKLILQPRVEADWYGKQDTARGLGDGLSDLSAGLRLRYEIRREVAPYLGVEWTRKFGETKDFAQDDGEDSSEMRFIAGLRFWY